MRRKINTPQPNLRKTPSGGKRMAIIISTQVAVPISLKLFWSFWEIYIKSFKLCFYLLYSLLHVYLSHYIDQLFRYFWATYCFPFLFLFVSFTFKLNEGFVLFFFSFSYKPKGIFFLQDRFLIFRNHY